MAGTLREMRRRDSQRIEIEYYVDRRIMMSQSLSISAKAVIRHVELVHIGHDSDSLITFR